MKYGIYYAYWEDKWEADYFKYIEKVAKLGFDFLEIACTPINGYDRECVMRTEGTYNLAAIPSLYLLDKDKTVLVKDGTDVDAIALMLTTK